jgi:hypothetical protein
MRDLLRQPRPSAVDAVRAASGLADAARHATCAMGSHRGAASASSPTR